MKQNITGPHTMKRTLTVVLAVFSVHAFPCLADQQPLWEFGVGMAGLSLPDYRGADTRSSYLLPVPYLVYRGQLLRADRGGVRATLFDSERVDLNLSFNLGLATRNGDNLARRGMPDLRPTLEVGPTLDFSLWRSATRRSSLDLRLPLRTAITVESSPRNIGWLFSPSFYFNMRDPIGMKGWKLGVQGGPMFATRSYNSYYYTVDPAQSLAERPAYAAPGGYSGVQFTTTLTKRFSRYWVGAFLRYDNLSGAAFLDSPLVQRRDGLTAGVGFAWVFAVSPHSVYVDPREELRE